MELSNDDTKLAENHWDNDVLPLLGTQPYLPHPPLVDTKVAPFEPLTHPYIEAGDVPHIACMADLPEVHLKGAYNMLFGIYQVWVHQNIGKHMNGGIK